VKGTPFGNEAHLLNNSIPSIHCLPFRSSGSWYNPHEWGYESGGFGTCWWLPMRKAKAVPPCNRKVLIVAVRSITMLCSIRWQCENHQPELRARNLLKSINNIRTATIEPDGDVTANRHIHSVTPGGSLLHVRHISAQPTGVGPAKPNASRLSSKQYIQNILCIVRLPVHLGRCKECPDSCQQRSHSWHGSRCSRL